MAQRTLAALPALRAAALAALALAVVLAPAPAAGAQSADQRPRTVRPAEDVDAPTMTNDMLLHPTPSLPPSWPAGARDAQVRVAACEPGETPLEARQKGESSDEVLPTLDAQASVLPPLLLAVRRQPLLRRSDVVAATFVAAKKGGYDVVLRLSDDGAAHATEALAANANACVALVAGGKVLWHPSTPEGVTDGTFVLRGGFDIAQATAIVSFFSGAAGE